MELLAYIHEEFVYSDQAIASDDNLSSPFPIELTFQTWLQRITTKSAKLSLSVILASTTVFIGLGSTLNAVAQTAPSSNVKYVQSLLAKNGFDPGAIDGVAGASTKNAIIRAQRSLGLAADGVAGSRTVAALEDSGSVTSINTKAEQKEPTAPVSSSVMNLQKLLADRGFYNGAVDGVMGSQTRAAIILAQKTYNLTPDGVAGSRTLAALESDGNKMSVTPISTPSLAKSAEISNLQELLSKRGFYNGAVDGLMGSQTRLAIVAAQRNYGLVTDGIAGSQTYAALEAGSSKVNIADRNRDVVSKATTDIKVIDKDVSALQQLLASRGFYKGAIDGVKGSQTNAAIASAQTAYGLTPDGVAGAQTMAALQNNLKPSLSVSPKPTTNNQVPPQAAKAVVVVPVSDDVANLQNLLNARGFYNGPITGFLGSRTKDAIIAAQKTYGLTADGIAGSQTIAALELGAPRQQIGVNNNVTPTVRVDTKPQSTPQPPQPKVTQPIVPQPTVTQPIVPQPTVTQPIVPQPTVTQPPVTQSPQPTPKNQPKPQESVAPQPKITPVSPTPQPQTSANNTEVLVLQNLLTKRGFYNGKPDGVLNVETRNAIVRAQNFYTISPANGLASNKLIDSLSKDTFVSEGN